MKPIFTEEWPQHWPVAYMQGSLPQGGYIESTPVFAFAYTPSQLVFKKDYLADIKRKDIDLSLNNIMAFTLSNLLTTEECIHLIEAGERLGFRPDAPGISTPPGMRLNKTVHWLADDSLIQPLFKRMQKFLPDMIDGRQLMPFLSQRLNMYKYNKGDVFNDHIDGDWPGYSLSEDRNRMDEWPNGRSCLTMLLYLNGVEEGVEGGATRLYGTDGNYTDVLPRQATALFFRHGFSIGSIRHKGCRVEGEVPKYVVRINIMYSS
ncbi:MAG: 2OG-Fe(II) oxygenase [Pseudomonadales bacterium]